MSTRAPAATEMANTFDQARCYTGLTESFMVTIRKIEGKSNAKIIWWYIAEVEQNVSAEMFSGESSFAARFFNYDDALQRLTYNENRDVLRRAISPVESSWSCIWMTVNTVDKNAPENFLYAYYTYRMIRTWLILTG